MAFGTITVNKRITSASGPVIHYDISVVGDDSYAAGGTAGAEAALRAGIAAGDGIAGSLSNLQLLSVSKIDATDHLALWDAANDKLKVVQISDGVELAGDRSSDTYRLLAVWA